MNEPYDKTNNFSAVPTETVIVGDALATLRCLPGGSVDAVVTSPPYFALRNYFVDGQIGAESTVEDWVAGLLAVMAEVARVLKPAGSVWLNLGDTYATHRREGAAPKSLLLGPERLVLALMADGWTVRNRVTWAKTNSMPHSVRDRLTTRSEALFLLVRSRSYYFDIDAVREPAKQTNAAPGRVNRSGKYVLSGSGRPAWAGPGANTNSGLGAMRASGRRAHVLGRNPGDVWTTATASYRGAHFATFPPALIWRPVMASCPEQVCTTCDQPWRRSPVPQVVGSLAVRGVMRKSCACPSRTWQPGIVLDPFFGAGTTGLVAEALNRRWLGIELNADYAELARQRIAAHRARAGRAAA